ncbi:MAG: hypothetical protein PUD02_00655 [Eggerthellales bacterium]|nr:hypothetical protein [Eggerthellales bacterium]
MIFFLAALGVMALAVLAKSLRINHQQHEILGVGKNGGDLRLSVDFQISTSLS